LGRRRVAAVGQNLPVVAVVAVVVVVVVGLGGLLAVLVVGSTIWVAFDHGFIKRTYGDGHIGDSAVPWILGCVLLWVLFFLGISLPAPRSETASR
jgi:hypothetical protein